MNKKVESSSSKQTTKQDGPGMGASDISPVCFKPQLIEFCKQQKSKEMPPFALQSPTFYLVASATTKKFST